MYNALISFFHARIFNTIKYGPSSERICDPRIFRNWDKRLSTGTTATEYMRLLHELGGGVNPSSLLPLIGALSHKNWFSKLEASITKFEAQGIEPDETLLGDFCAVCYSPNEPTFQSEHPLFEVTLCGGCHDFYNGTQWTCSDTSELECRMCGYGGQVCLFRAAWLWVC